MVSSWCPVSSWCRRRSHRWRRSHRSHRWRRPPGAAGAAARLRRGEGHQLQGRVDGVRRRGRRAAGGPGEAQLDARDREQAPLDGDRPASGHVDLVVDPVHEVIDVEESPDDVDLVQRGRQIVDRRRGDRPHLGQGHGGRLGQGLELQDHPRRLRPDGTAWASRKALASSAGWFAASAEAVRAGHGHPRWRSARWRAAPTSRPPASAPAR